MIIYRCEVKAVDEIKKWTLIYGRRKTGKTFMVEHFIDYDEYFFVKRDRTIVSEKDSKQIDYGTATTLIERVLADGKTIVVDEFHRLGDDFLDFLQQVKKSGRLILISSTLHLSKKLFRPSSPILGFFAEFPIGLIALEDTLAALGKQVTDRKGLLELAILLREPLVVDYLAEDARPRGLFTTVLSHSIKTVPALVGEIFTEEERTLSRVYEGIMRAVANGKCVSSEISSYLFSRRLVEKDDPSLVQPYLNNLMDFGVIKRIRVYNRNRFIYKHVSPLARLFYYADEKYNISESEVTPAVVERLVEELMPRIVEDNIREFLAEYYGLQESIMEHPDYDIDALLLRHKKQEVAVEIKWKNKVNQKDVSEVVEKLGKTNAKQKMLFVPDKTKIKTKAHEIEIKDITDYTKKHGEKAG